MKVIDILKRAPLAFRALADYFRLRPLRFSQDGSAGYEVFTWTMLATVVGTSLLHMFVEISPFKMLQQEFDKRDVLYFLMVKDGRPYVAPVKARLSDKERPVFLRVETLFFGSSDRCNAESSQVDLRFVFFQVGLAKRTGICIPLNPDQSMPSVVGSTRESDLTDSGLLAKFDESTFADIARYQSRLPEWIVDEVALGFGFSRILFRNAQMGELGKNKPYLLVVLLGLLVTSVATIHLAAAVAGARASFRQSIEIGLYSLAAAIFLAFALNCIGAAAPSLVTRINPFSIQALLLGCLVIGIIPGLYALIRHYALTAGKSLLVLALALPFSLATGLVIFLPTAGIATIYHEYLQILL
jgi:hypothetical protein